MSGLLTFEFCERNTKSGKSIVHKMKRLPINSPTDNSYLSFILSNMKSSNYQ